MKIQIINGINLNLLGVRDPKTYGTKQFELFLAELRQQYPAVQLDYFQSNLEGDIVNKLQEVGTASFSIRVLSRTTPTASPIWWAR